MPVYWPPTTNNYDMKNLWWSVVPSAASNRPSRKGLPVGLSLRSEPASGSDDISDLFLEGTVSAGSERHRPRAGTYKVDIRWNWLKTSSEQGKRGFRTYTDCKIKLIESRPEAPACPTVRKFRKGVYTSVQLSYGKQVSLSQPIPGMTVVRDGRSWNLRGVPSRAGTYSARLVREGSNWSVQSGVCVFTVHTLPPVTVTAVDTSITEGNAGSSTVYQYLDGNLGGLRGKFVSVSSDPPWNQARSWHQRRGWASVKLSRAVEAGEPPVYITVRARAGKSGSERSTAGFENRTMPEKPEAYQRAENRGRMDSYSLTEGFRQYWTDMAVWEGPPSEGKDYRRWQSTSTAYPTALIVINPGASSAAAGVVSVYGDTDTEPGEYFWWEIVSVSDGVAAAPSGDAAWGKATITNDDIVVPPTPTEPLCVPADGESSVSDKGGCLTPPWRITAENVGLSRPTSSVIVGLPLTFYLKNVDPNPDPNQPQNAGEPDGVPYSTAAADLACSTPQELVDSVVIPVDVARLIQVIIESDGVVYPEGDYGGPWHSVQQTAGG